MMHEIRELSVSIQLEGDFESVHFAGDNSSVLPTDTMKNTVYCLAKEHPVDSAEEFAKHLAGYFLDNNKQVTKATIETDEKLWIRIPFKDKNTGEINLHTHSFVSAGNERRTAKISNDRKNVIVQSGIKDLLVLKTTGSGFEKYIKDKYTTLKETGDRVFSTSVEAVWSYANRDVNYARVTDEVRRIILEIFSHHHSLSVQQTLYEIGKNVIDEIEEVDEISLSLPNKHYLLFNLEQFQMDNRNEIFIPTDEPFGLIEGTVKRST